MFVRIHLQKEVQEPCFIAFIAKLVPSTKCEKPATFLFPGVFHSCFSYTLNQLKLDKCRCSYDLSSSYTSDFSFASLCNKKYLSKCFCSFLMIGISDTYC